MTMWWGLKARVHIFSQLKSDQSFSVSKITLSPQKRKAPSLLFSLLTQTSQRCKISRQLICCRLIFNIHFPRFCLTLPLFNLCQKIINHVNSTVIKEQERNEKMYYSYRVVVIQMPFEEEYVLSFPFVLLTVDFTDCSRELSFSFNTPMSVWMGIKLPREIRCECSEIKLGIVFNRLVIDWIMNKRKRQEISDRKYLEGNKLFVKFPFQAIHSRFIRIRFQWSKVEIFREEEFHFTNARGHFAHCSWLL